MGMSPAPQVPPASAFRHRGAAGTGLVGRAAAGEGGGEGQCRGAMLAIVFPWYSFGTFIHFYAESCHAFFIKAWINF
jgi:hypothetical protein